MEKFPHIEKPKNTKYLVRKIEENIWIINAYKCLLLFIWAAAEESEDVVLFNQVEKYAKWRRIRSRRLQIFVQKLAVGWGAE